ncbi:hypothetical protein AWB81_04269 [Caballeronia arationis]|jgi:hypothetical protein|uniref:Uncharacterized protein n=1 Tax=Caballeronia arationis TaxID=1777142 RepID=A0A7Z7N1V7_9BURK|nr:hypothetical protein AWB81_04269 [Caballeronia arationis]SOE61293.1 hypothetical protein SAMN05446927_2080 [Caballeronia arationis]
MNKKCVRPVCAIVEKAPGCCIASWTKGAGSVARGALRIADLTQYVSRARRRDARPPRPTRVQATCSPRAAAPERQLRIPAWNMQLPPIRNKPGNEPG